MRRSKRPGYTLLEVMLAISIGLLLVAALYVALDLQMRYMATGRDAVVEAQMSRGLLLHVSKDIRDSLALLNTSPSWRSQVPATQNATQNGSTTQESTPPTETTDQLGTGQDHVGLYGDEQSLYLYVTRLPRYGAQQQQEQFGFSDMRRITYALQPGQGLARQEVRNVRATGGLDGEEPAVILAPEVTELHFRYFDGTSNTWVTTWDGSLTGPPRAIEVTITLQPFNARNEQASTRSPTTHRLVVAVPTGAVMPDPAQAGTMP